MPIRVLEIHHHAVRAGDDDGTAQAAYDFYHGVLGLDADGGRPTIPGVPGFWMNVGTVGQIHLIAGATPSPLAKGDGQDPTAAHAQYALTEVADECRHSVMFGRMIAKLGCPVYRVGARDELLGKYLTATARGVRMFATILIAEEILDAHGGRGES